MNTFSFPSVILKIIILQKTHNNDIQNRQKNKGFCVSIFLLLNINFEKFLLLHSL